MAAQAPELRRPRWGYQTSLFQPRRFAFWVFAALVGLGTLNTVALQDAWQRVSPTGWALSWGLMVLYAVPVFLTVYLLDLYEREPASLLIGALLWGLGTAPLLASIGNEGWGLFISRVADPTFALEWTAALTAPFVEEIVKAAGVILLVLIARAEFDDVMDGFVYGAMVGLGFTVLEDVFYFMAHFGGHPEGVLVGFFLRVVASGLYSHVLYTGLTGMGIAYFVTRRGEATFARRLSVSAGLFAVAIFGHFLWNSPLLNFLPEPPWTASDWIQIPLATAVKGVPLLVFVLLMVRLARGREARWLAGALASEVGLGGVDAAELQALTSPRQRRRAVGEMRRRAGGRAADLLKRLQRQQINLAMIATRVSGPGGTDLARQREYCKSLREALRAIPGAAPAEVSGTA